MRCPECGGTTHVTDTRKGDADSIYRRRQCEVCQHRFSTRERARLADTVEHPPIYPIAQKCRCQQCVCKTYTNAAVICAFCVRGWHQSPPLPVDSLLQRKVASKDRA